MPGSQDGISGAFAGDRRFVGRLFRARRAAGTGQPGSGTLPICDAELYSRSVIFWHIRYTITTKCPIGNNLLAFLNSQAYIPEREHDMTPKKIGLKIRELRKRQGLRQDQLAGAAGVGLRFLIELEAGKETAQLGKTLAVLNALGCKIELADPGGDGS